MDLEGKMGRKVSVVDEQLRGDAKAVDESDPIYDSESEDEDCFYTVIDVAADEHRQALNRRSFFSTGATAPPTKAPISLDAFLRIAKEALDDFYESYETQDLSASLQELNCPQFLDAFTVLAIRLALDRSLEQQKKISASLTLITDQKITTKQQLVRAFEKLVQSAEDLNLDVPGAADRIYAFLECAALDGCIEQEYVQRLPQKFLSLLSSQTLQANPQLKQRLAEIKAFKSAAKEFLLDFFESGDPEEIQQFLVEQQQPLLQHDFVKMAVEASFAKSNQHREMTSNALDCLYGKTLTADDIQLGFARLVGAIDDIYLDNPNAYDLLSKFLARAIADEILPPSFLGDRYRLHYGGPGGMRVLKKVQKWMSRQSAVAARMRKVWTGTDPDKKEVTEFKEQVKECLYDFFETFDVSDALQRLSTLELSPDQGVEVIRKLLVVCMEKAATRSRAERAQEATFRLLRELVAQACVDEDAIIKGFEQARELIPEIKLDIPNVEEQLAPLEEAARKRGFLPALSSRTI